MCNQDDRSTSIIVQYVLVVFDVSMSLDETCESRDTFFSVKTK